MFKHVNGVDAIHYDTTEFSYILNAILDATSVTGTRKVQMLKRKVTEDTVDLHFFRHSADDGSKSNENDISLFPKNLCFKKNISNFVSDEVWT